MGLYEGIKDVAKVVQQADNVDLYKKLLDLGAQALDMQDEIAKLKAENLKLQNEKSLFDSIEYHNTLVNSGDQDYQEYPYITLESDKEKIRYCAICWGKNQKLIPLYDELNCMVCRQEMK